MANFNLALNLAGGVPTAMTSSAVNTTAQLSAGTYAVWTTSVAAYIQVGAPLSSTAVAGSSNGYPIIAGTLPQLVNVPYNGQISAISTAANLLMYQKVG